jgi:eukaryotic-like serine/threonine-protein kinase
MGEVYRARDAKLDRQVAIKVLPRTVAEDPDRRARVEREARALAALNHPNIAHIYGVEETGDGVAIVMELVEGEDLAARIARGPLSWHDAQPIARQLAEALDAAHERGIVQGARLRSRKGGGGRKRLCGCGPLANHHVTVHTLRNADRNGGLHGT